MMLAARGAIRASGAGLPYDAEVEYAYFDTSSIDTGIDYFPDFRILAGTNGNVRNVTIRCDDNHLLERMSSTTPYWSIVAGDTSGSRITTDVPVSGVHFIELYNGSVKADGASYGTIPNRTWASGIRCRIPRDANTYQFYLYSAKLYDESHNLVRDYIPVRVSVNGAAVGALYDRANPHGGPNRNGLYFSSLNPLVCGPDVLPVEYLESVGYQYIDTGVVPSEDLETDITFSYSNITNNVTPFGSRSTASSNDRYWANYDGHFEIGFGNYYATSVTTTVGAVNTIEFNKLVNGAHTFVFNGTSYTQTGTPNTTTNIILFGRSVGGTPYRCNMKLFSCDMIKGADKIRRFIPVRVGTDATSWEGAMMDTLTRRIYRNAGIGAFTYGNDRRYPIPA